MKRVHVPIDGVQYWHHGRWQRLGERQLTCRRITAWLALAIAFGAGFTAAVWTVGIITTAR